MMTSWCYRSHTDAHLSLHHQHQKTQYRHRVKRAYNHYYEAGAARICEAKIQGWIQETCGGGGFEEGIRDFAPPSQNDFAPSPHMTYKLFQLKVAETSSNV